MISKRKPAKGKRINPHFWVFCEGKTEEAYVHFLRSEYRLPIEIIPKIAGSSISERYIKNYKRGKPIHKKDRDFLIYDADVKEVLENLQKIKSAVLIASNPAIELWFLLHLKNQTAFIKEDACIRHLSNYNRNQYNKGIIDPTLSEKLKNHVLTACKRAKALKLFNNPSSNFNVFIEELEQLRNKKNEYNI